MHYCFNQSKKGKSAFLLNANAKNVGGAMLSRLVEMVPTGDLYLSHSLNDSKKFLRSILDKGYEQVFSGGGDGTLMNTMSTMIEIAGGRKSGTLPRIGVLRLGTGNAVARILGAKKPLVDVNHVLQGGRFDERELRMIQCEDGGLAPFAGIGLDGEVLNDYVALRASRKGQLSNRILKTAFGYVWAGMTRTAPRHLVNSDPRVRITSAKPSVQVVHKQGVDCSVPLAAGQVLYEGPASMVSVGSIPCFGYGFQMFPHLKKEEFFNKMQLRVCNAGVWPIIANLYPSLWKGTYRGPYVYDFVLEHVKIESEAALPYQVAGDAKGFKKEISFSMSEKLIAAVELDKHRLPLKGRTMALLPAYALAR